MATTKPRITITLEPRVYEVVRRLAAVNGESMSSVVSGFLEVAVPPMERAVALLEQAARVPQQAREDVRASLARAERDVLPQLLSAVEQTDMFLAGEVASIEAVMSKAAAEPRPAKSGRKVLSTPVPVTRGSGPPNARQREARKPAKAAVKRGSRA